MTIPHPQELISLLRGHTVFIQTHDFPDPDALAAAQGLKELLELQRVASTICYCGPIDASNLVRMCKNFGIQPRQMSNDSPPPEDGYIVLVDGRKGNNNFTDLQGEEVACIDHHDTPTPHVYEYSDIRPDVGACSSIIVSYFKTLGLPISDKVAAALAYGITMDTANFTRKTSSFDVDMFAYTFSFADKKLLGDMHNNHMDRAKLETYASAIKNIKIEKNEYCGEIGFANIPFNCPDGHRAYVADIILSLEEVTVAVVYSENETGWKFSVRSELPEMGADVLIREALEGIGSGGGHYCAAGGRIAPQQLELLQGDYNKCIIDRFCKATKRVHELYQETVR